MDTSGTGEEHHQKKGRHRKKQLYASLLQQMEFYFSDSNLAKDRFMSQLLLNDQYIDLNVFLTFNKILKLTSSTDDLVKAINKSEILELSDDKTKVCRKTPIQQKDNVDECTIYVENIKSDATHDWLKSVFSEFGNVAYVSIPRYKNNSLNKGFAFIEFEEEETAIKTLQFFEEIDCKMSSQMVPDQLISIATFEPKEDMAVNKEVPDSQIINNSEKNEVKNESEYDQTNLTESNNIIINSKKRKECDDEISEEGNERKKLKTSTDPEIIKEEVINSHNMSDKKKKKKLHKRKAYFREIGLQILSKKEWKKMRNKYLNMQREKMKALKAHLNKKRFANTYEKTRNFTDSDAGNMDVSDDTKHIKNINFIPGVIIKVKLREPSYDSKKLKLEIKNCAPGVEYIDVPLANGSEEIFLRFSNSDYAMQFLNSSYDGEKSLLEGENEQEYWDKIKSHMELKINKDKKKQRGRQKLLKRAERELGKHIKFDDCE